jgi:hypothetical protein
MWSLLTKSLDLRGYYHSLGISDSLLQRWLDLLLPNRLCTIYSYMFVLIV